MNYWLNSIGSVVWRLLLIYENIISLTVQIHSDNKVRKHTFTTLEKLVSIWFNAMKNSKQKNQTTKSPSKIKIFQCVQKNFATAGVGPVLSLQPYPLNLKIKFGFLLGIFYIICDLVFLFVEAKTFTEYMQSIYMGFCPTLSIFGLVVIISKAKKLFQVINDCENLVNASKYENRLRVYLSI